MAIARSNHLLWVINLVIHFIWKDKFLAIRKYADLWTVEEKL